MKTVKFDLLWIAPNKGDMPFSPIAHIVPKSDSRHNYKNINLAADWPLLTPQCMSAAELDEQIDLMVKDLEKIRREGHKRFERRFPR